MTEPVTYVSCASGWCEAAAVYPPGGTPRTGGENWHYEETPFGSGDWYCPSCSRWLEKQEEAVDLRVELEHLREEHERVVEERDWLKRVVADALRAARGRRIVADGDVRIPLFAQAMGRELEANDWKGDWRDDRSFEIAKELLYHALKLLLAVDHRDRERILEFAADCGNLAMMAADVAGALDPQLLGDPGEAVERDKYHPPPYRERIEHVRRMTREVVREAVGATEREMQVRALVARHPSGQIVDVPF